MAELSLKDQIKKAEEAIKKAEDEIAKAKAAGIDTTELEKTLNAAKENLAKLKAVYGK